MSWTEVGIAVAVGLPPAASICICIIAGQKHFFKIDPRNRDPRREAARQVCRLIVSFSHLGEDLPPPYDRPVVAPRGQGVACGFRRTARTPTRLESMTLRSVNRFR